MLTTEKVTLTLPVDVMESVRTFAPPRRQSQFIAEAIRFLSLNMSGKVCESG